MLPELLRQSLDLRADTATPLHGGCLNQVVKVQQNSGEYCVLKWGGKDHACFFEQEAHSLSVLGAVSGVRVPAVLEVGETEGYAYLQLAYVEADTRHDETALVSMLLAIHAVEHTHHGFDTDNFIGRTPQFNTYHATWGEFFVDQRLRPQLAFAHRDGWLDEDPEELLDSIADGVMRLLNRGAGEAVLQHGDLWSGNVLWSSTGPYFIDPACFYGSRESDLAFTKMFGGFSESFYREYFRQAPVPEGFEERVPILNLYHLLNHAHLFGGSYQSQAKSVLKRLPEVLTTRM